MIISAYGPYCQVVCAAIDVHNSEDRCHYLHFIEEETMAQLCFS